MEWGFAFQQRYSALGILMADEVRTGDAGGPASAKVPSSNLWERLGGESGVVNEPGRPITFTSINESSKARIRVSVSAASIDEHI